MSRFVDAFTPQKPEHGIKEVKPVSVLPALGAESRLPSALSPHHDQVLGEVRPVRATPALGLGVSPCAPLLIYCDVTTQQGGMENPVSATTLPCEDHSPRRESKRGRSLSWSPSPVTEEDATFSTLVGTYDPDETSAASFAERYRTFRTINR